MEPSAALDPLSRPQPWDRYWIGTSYYPEQWPRAQWAEDFAKMSELGVNLVRMAEFAWSSIQPSRESFDFDWLDKAIALAGEQGISVILGTPTASIPPWLYKLHPDTLGANESGPYTYGGRKGFALQSPAMREAAERVIARMGTRYGNNTTVVGWQISNEPGYPMVNFDHNAVIAFRVWLKERYGNIAKLNAVWSGTFWSNRYDDWDEIVFPTNSAEGGWNPGIRLDYRRFFSDSFLKWLRFEADIIRRYSQGQFLYTNWPDTRWFVDIRQAASFLDATAWDNYGTMPGTADFHDVLHSGLDHDICRGSRSDQRFFVAEQPSQTYADAPDAGVRLATYIDMAHGAAGTVYFEWRPPAIGSERGYVSMLEADGSFGRSADQLRKLKAEMARLGPLLSNAQTVADVAMIYSYQNQWEQGSRRTEKQNPNAAYDAICERYYVGARSLGRNVDVIATSADLSKYRLAVAPSLQLVSDEEVAALEKFVKDGGILLLNHNAGKLDQDGRLRPLVEPGPFRPMAGVRVPASLESHRAIPRYTIAFGEPRKTFVMDESVAKVELEGATVLATLAGEGLDGLPALTTKSYGKGHVVFLAAESREPEFFDTLFAALGQLFSIAPLLEVPKGVFVQRRTKNGRDYIFVLNTNRSAIELKLPEACTELISGKRAEGLQKVEGLDVAIYEQR